MKYRSPFAGLPEDVRQRPDVMDHRLLVVEDHHYSPKQQAEVQTPFGKVPLPIAVIILGWLMYQRPDLVLRFLGAG